MRPLSVILIQRCFLRAVRFTILVSFAGFLFSCASTETAQRSEQRTEEKQEATGLPGPIPDREDYLRVRGYDFSSIDRYALAAPSAKEKSVKRLAKYLADGAENDFERVRAVYRWITANIGYDVEAYYSSQTPNDKPEHTLRTRSSVCEGYSKLFAELSNRMGVETVRVSGNCRTYCPAGKMLDTSHAWNSVKIDGMWWLVDSTWGAGHLTWNEAGEQVFEREFKEFYFLPRPSRLIYSHFPQDPSWQLLEQQLTRKEFENRVQISQSFFTLGYSPDMLPSLSLWVEAQGKVTFMLPDLVDGQLFASLYPLLPVDENGSTVENTRALVPGEELESRTFSQKVGDQWLIQAVFPERGDYQLDVWTSLQDDSHYLFRYNVAAASGSPRLTYPGVYDFGLEGMYLHSPVTRNLRAGETYLFKLEAGGAARIRVSEFEPGSVGPRTNKVALQKQGRLFRGSFTPRTPGREVVVFMYPENDPTSGEGVIYYQVIE
jgi:hypothetical protein